jgi:transcriptional regulator with XRE-family HTH domain
MATTPGPVMPRRRLAAELRRQREAARLTLEEVANELLISTSKLSRLEKAQGSPQARDVRDLIRLYKLEGTETAEQLMRWVRAARRRAWWHDYTDTIAASGLDTHVATEAEASVIRVYTIPVLPVLLQTPAYTRALYERMEPWWSAHDLERLLQVRALRREALEKRDGMAPLRLVAVTHESSIRQAVGDSAIMREQLDYLIERSEMSYVELRILPFSVTPPFTSTCMWAYFEFEGSYDRDLVHVETHAGFRYIETADLVNRYRRYYDELVRSSLDPDRSRELIGSVRRESFAG